MDRIREMKYFEYRSLYLNIEKWCRKSVDSSGVQICRQEFCCSRLNVQDFLVLNISKVQ